MEVNFAKVERMHAVHVARMLSGIFYRGELLLQTSFGLPNLFLQTWFGSNKYSSLIRRIISDYAHEFHESESQWPLGANERQWALEVGTSARTLFRPLIKACASTWLTKTGWDDEAYLDMSFSEVWIIYAFITMVSPSARGCS